MSWFVTTLALLGLLAGLGAALHVSVLLNRVVKPLRESKRYMNAILEAAQATERNLEGAAELERTRDLLRKLGVGVT